MFIEFETFYNTSPLLISKEHIIAVKPDPHHEGASCLFVMDDRTFTVIYDYEKLKALLLQ